MNYLLPFLLTHNLLGYDEMSTEPSPVSYIMGV